MSTTTTTTTTTTNDNDNTPLPSPPFHLIPNIHNLRDVALYPLTTPSGPVRPSILFRSADVSALTPNEWPTLSTLGITHIFDLRSAPEVNDLSTSTTPWHTAMSCAGIQRTWTPVFTQQDYSPAGLAARYAKYMSRDAQGFVRAYRDIMRSGCAAYAVILRHLISCPGQGVLVHCTAGKDRTGVFVAVVLAFLGVGAQEVAGEYQLTEAGLRGVREAVVQRLVRGDAVRRVVAAEQLGRDLSDEESARLAAGEEVVVVGEEAREVGRQAALRMVGAKKETMLAVLDMLEKEFGGAERYLREHCGLSDGDLDALRRNLIVEEA